MIGTALKWCGDVLYSWGADGAAEFFYRWARRFGARMQW